MTSDLVLYDSAISGNAYKVRLLLSHLGLTFQRIEFDVDDGSTRTAEFLAKNPNGKVPTIRLADGSHLFESNAILYYFAEGTKYWPAELNPKGKRDRAAALQWMFFEQYSHEPYIAVARFWKHFFTKLTPQQEIELPGRMEKGYAALGVMEQHLAHHLFFVDERFGLADIALYGYTHCAGEGGFNLDNFPQVNAWLARVAAQPGHVTIEHKN